MPELVPDNLIPEELKRPVEVPAHLLPAEASQEVPRDLLPTNIQTGLIVQDEVRAAIPEIVQQIRQAVVAPPQGAAPQQAQPLRDVNGREIYKGPDGKFYYK